MTPRRAALTASAALMLAGCGQGVSPGAADDNTLAWSLLHRCENATNAVAMFGGVDDEGFRLTHHGDVPEADAYVVTPDGTTTQLTDQRPIDGFDIADDARTAVIASWPRSSEDNPDPLAQLIRYDLLTGQEELLYEAAGVSRVAISPDGRRVAAVVAEAGASAAWLGVLDVDGPGEWRRTPTASDENTERHSVYEALWSPDGTTLVYSILTPSGYEIRAWDIGTGDQRTLPLDGRQRTLIDWSPEGSRILLLRYEATEDSPVSTLNLIELDVGNYTETAMLEDPPSFPPDQASYADTHGSAFLALDGSQYGDSGATVTLYRRIDDGSEFIAGRPQPVPTDSGASIISKPRIAGCALR